MFVQAAFLILFFYKLAFIALLLLMKTFLPKVVYGILTALFFNCSGQQQNDSVQTKTDTLQISNPESASIPEQTNTTGFSRNYQGEIASKYPIRMQLTRTGNELTGTYAYIKVGKDIPLAGSVDNEGKFSIQETDDKGKITGVFEGRFSSATQLAGNWRNPDTGKEMPFSLQEANETVATKSIMVGAGIPLLENSFTLEGKNGIDGEYTFPYLLGKGTVVNKINGALSAKSLTDETIDDIKTNFKECSCGTVGVSYNINYNANNILDISVFVETLGAYSSGYVNRLTFDTRTGEKLSISSILKPASLTQLAFECDQLLQERIKKSIAEADEGEGADWLKELTQDRKFETEHLNNFSISPEGITFYYPFGFPHAALALEPDDAFLFTFNQLKDDIDPASILSPLVQGK